MSIEKSSVRPLLLAVGVAGLVFWVMWQWRPAATGELSGAAAAGGEPSGVAAPSLPVEEPSETAPAPRVEPPAQVAAEAGEATADQAADKPRPTPRPGERAADLVDESYQRARNGMRLQPSKAIELFNYFKDNPADGRPQLVLGLDAINRGWYEQAVGHYLKAFRADARLRDEPRMLNDLLDVASMGLYHDEAAEAIVEIFGADVLEVVDQRIAHARQRGQTRHAELLGDLRSDLLR